jgi:transcriptional regulator with AAA-type ATPase domain
LERTPALAASRKELLKSLRALIEQRYVPSGDNRIIVVGPKGTGKSLGRVVIVIGLL